MAKKESAASNAANPFGVQVGEWFHADNYNVLGVPSGYVVFHGSTACFVPAVEQTDQP